MQLDVSNVFQPAAIIRAVRWEFLRINFHLDWPFFSRIPSTTTWLLVRWLWSCPAWEAGRDAMGCSLLPTVSKSPDTTVNTSFPINSLGQSWWWPSLDEGWCVLLMWLVNCVCNGQSILSRESSLTVLTIYPEVSASVVSYQVSVTPLCYNHQNKWSDEMIQKMTGLNK